MKFFNFTDFQFCGRFGLMLNQLFPSSFVDHAAPCSATESNLKPRNPKRTVCKLPAAPVVKYVVGFVRFSEKSISGCLVNGFQLSCQGRYALSFSPRRA